jgi:hypothetical protein
MIIIRLMGGLGNQLFQYALGRRLSWMQKVPLKLDTSKLDHLDPPRKFALDDLQTKTEIASLKDVWRVSIPHRSDFPARVRNYCERHLPYYRRSVITEPHYHFTPEILKAPRNAYLIGYWQSEKYFLEIRDLLIEDLELKNPLSLESQKYLDKIQNTNAVSMHIRQGDYQTNPQYRNTYEECLPEYYTNAVEYLVERFGQIQVFAFSDEPDWVKQNIHLPVPLTIIERQNPSSDVEDMFLISTCHHHIIANSTFSWWGAWLSQHPEKTVIAPNKWFKDQSVNTKDLLPQEWIRI